MQFDGAVIEEQGVTFAIVIVKPHILNSPTQIEEVRSSFTPFFPRMPIILMAQNAKGVPTYHGRNDIVKFLANVHPIRIPWKRYTV